MPNLAGNPKRIQARKARDPLCLLGKPYSQHTHPHECNFTGGICYDCPHLGIRPIKQGAMSAPRRAFPSTIHRSTPRSLVDGLV